MNVLIDCCRGLGPFSDSSPRSDRLGHRGWSEP